MIVCADADIDRAADGAVFGAFAYTGQVCISVERVYVEEPVYDEFVSKVVAKTAQLRQGMDAEHDYSCEVGSMTTAQQLAIVSGHVDDAVSKGARVLVGGKSGDPATEGLFYQPTVLVDVDHGMTCMREETFGPTLPVMKVRDVAEAIEKANDSRLGLSGSVWTRDKNKAMASGAQDEHRHGEHQQRHHGRLPIPVAVCGLERIGAGFALRRGRRDPQILPHQKHCGRPGCDEKGTALVSLQRQEGQDSSQPWSG